MMRIFGIAGLGLLATVLLAGCEEPAPPPPKEMSHYLQTPSPMRLVQVMSGRSREGRTDVVRRALDAAGIAYVDEPFTVDRFRGTNVIAEIGHGEGLLVIVTHTDPIPDTPAANDNASCVAAAVSALQTLKTDPPKNLRVRFLFSDGEEYGLLGAKHHAGRADIDAAIGVVSFEMCGIGDAFGIWDVTGAVEGSTIVGALQKAGGNMGVYNGVHDAVPRFGSDHRAFSDKGLPGVGITVLPRDDENTLRRYIDNPDNPLWLIKFLRPAIFQTYHTSADRPDRIQPAALEMTARLMVEAVRVLDAGQGEK